MSINDSVLGGIAYALGVVVWFFIYDGTLFSLTIGSVCFAIILMAIPYYRLDFFLGRPGILSDKNIDPIESVIIYMGNFIGVMWIGLLVKLFGPHSDHLVETAHYVLTYLYGLHLDTVFLISVFSGMMFYAGAMTVNIGHSPLYFWAASFVCMMAHWPMIHVVWFSLWVDSWSDYWYLIIPVTLGNIIGSNVWVILRKHSPTYKNKTYITPDTYDIADKFHDFVSDKKNQESNKDSLFHMSDESSQDS